MQGLETENAPMIQEGDEILKKIWPAGSLISDIQHGGVPEWPKGADCKSVVKDFEGSNPSPSTICGCSSVAEPQPSKLIARVRFPSPAPYKTFIIFKRKPG